MPEPSKVPTLMLRSEVAEYLRMSERNVRRLEDQGRLRSLKLTPGRPGRVVFRREEVLRFIAEAEQAPTAIGGKTGSR